jgi:acyl-homoserine-lactone acylase
MTTSGPKTPDMSRIETLLFANRDLLADLVLDDLLVACKAHPTITGSDGKSRDLTRTCAILAAWDRKDEMSSVGAHIFREFAREERVPGEEDPATAADFWLTPFDPNDPVTTPRGLRVTGDAPLQALARAADRLEAAGVALDARLGDIQFIERNGVRIALHGGLIYNRISLTLQHGGYTEPMGSADSYLQVVTFDAQGPVADTLLVNSQSSDAGSPWYADQAPLYVKKQWVHPPFSLKDVAGAAIEPPTHLVLQQE